MSDTKVVLPVLVAMVLTPGPNMLVRSNISLGRTVQPVDKELRRLRATFVPGYVTGIDFVNKRYISNKLRLALYEVFTALDRGFFPATRDELYQSGSGWNAWRQHREILLFPFRVFIVYTVFCCFATTPLIQLRISLPTDM